MSEVAEKLKSAALQLSELERLELADFIYDSIPTPPPSPYEEGSTEFDAMLARRLDDLTSGRDKGIPAEEVMERLRKKYAK